MTKPQNIFFRDYGLRVTAEYRVGPEVTCEVVALKWSDGWIIDKLETRHEWRRKGHAKAVLEFLVKVSGMPVRACVIYPEAEAFWDHMTELGINA